MALIKILTPDFTFSDDRGTLSQLVSGGYQQVNAVFTKKGSVRGRFHYHKFTEEAFYIIKGKIRVTARLDGETEGYVFSDGDMFSVSKNVRHDFDYLEDTCLVVLYTQCVLWPDGTKDIFTDE